MSNKAIFLIDTFAQDREFLCRTIEKLTSQKVFRFFSLDEASLYTKLNPGLLLCANINLKTTNLPKSLQNIELINLSERVNQLGKGHLVSHSDLMLQIF